MLALPGSLVDPTSQRLTSPHKNSRIFTSGIAGRQERERRVPFVFRGNPMAPIHLSTRAPRSRLGPRKSAERGALYWMSCAAPGIQTVILSSGDSGLFGRVKCFQGSRRVDQGRACVHTDCHA